MVPCPTRLTADRNIGNGGFERGGRAVKRGELLEK